MKTDIASLGPTNVYGNKVKVRATEVADRFSKAIIVFKIASISDFCRNKSTD
ncbi:MAG TPA: hypothetical protein VEL11_16155 [Candidatus Bathyarchaeia archaeon]|nr:hypothetical protein [Candidatus Bathyarchaeia archaeon]